MRAGRQQNTGKKNTEEAIMAASEELFLEKGYRQATTTEIARRAGVTHAMLHYYFHTKEQIFFEVLDKNLCELFFSVRQAMSETHQTFWENLQSGVLLLLRFLDQHRQLPGLVYEVSRHNPDLLKRYRENMVQIIRNLGARHQKLLEREVAEGRCNDVSFEQLFLDIVTLSFSTYMWVPSWGKITDMPEDELERVLLRRHEEIIALLYNRLYGHGLEVG